MSKNSITVDGKDYFVSPCYGSSVGILGDATRQYVPPQGCKDYLHDAMEHHFYPKVAAKKGTTCMANKAVVPVNLIQIGTAGIANHCKENFAAIEEKLDLQDKTEHMGDVLHSGKNGSSIWRIPGWWMRSPVLFSLWLTILRHSHVDTIWQFSKHGWNAQNGNASSTSSYLQRAKEIGNLARLEANDMPCMKREGYSDYILSSHGRGISGYNFATDDNPLSEADLLANKKGFYSYDDNF